MLNNHAKIDNDSGFWKARLSMLPKNLRQLRSERGFTQAEVAKRAGISIVAYRRLESGISRPKPEILRRLTVALGIPMPELSAPAPPLKGIRFRGEKALKHRGQVISDVSRWLRDFNDLETLLSERIPFLFKDIVMPTAGMPPGKRRAFEAAKIARRTLDLNEKEPIHDICSLLESHGIKVCPLVLESEGLFGFSVAPRDGGPAVIVNVRERISVERWIFTAAHELGHLVLHADSYKVGETVEVQEQEEEANLFASHFLMPDVAFRRKWAECSGQPLIERVFKIKRIFRLSYRTVLGRLIEDGTYDTELWRMFNNEYRLHFGDTLIKRNELVALIEDSFRTASPPEAKRALEPFGLTRWDFLESRLKRLVREGVEKGKITLSRGAEILEMRLLQMRAIAANWGP